uniref:Uncharacterized protein n=1 Tax=Hymenochirus boettgeri TaxID=247094 RepID=A0A8T2IH45_9PIPI|nr:hypothetical protein GDO86_020003 [Hymenochirus boettgeri]
MGPLLAETDSRSQICPVDRSTIPYRTAFSGNKVPTHRTIIARNERSDTWCVRTHNRICVQTFSLPSILTTSVNEKSGEVTKIITGHVVLDFFFFLFSSQKASLRP